MGNLKNKASKVDDIYFNFKLFELTRRTILTGITPFPLELSRKMIFVDCLLNKEYKLKDIHSKKYP